MSLLMMRCALALTVSALAADYAHAVVPLSDFDPNNPHIGRWTVLDNTGLGDLDEASQGVVYNADGSAELLACGLNWQNEDGKTYSYNFGTDHTWRSDVYPPRPHILNHQGTIVWRNKFILFGGCDNTGQLSLDYVQSLDIATKTWTMLKPMPYLSCAPLTTVIEDKAYVCGGFPLGFRGLVAEENLNTCAVYDLVNDSWTTMEQLFPYPRNHGTATTDGSKLYIIGGREYPNSKEVDENIVQIYDPATQKWITSRDVFPGAPAPISPGRAGVYNCPFHPQLKEFICCGGEIASAPKSVYALHGIQDGTYIRCDAFSPEKNVWRRIANMPRGVGDMYVRVIGWDIYVAGGSWHFGQDYQGNPFYRLDFPTLGESQPNYGYVPPAGVEHLSKGNEASSGYGNACVVGSTTPVCTQVISRASLVPYANGSSSSATISAAVPTSTNANGGEKATPQPSADAVNVEGKVEGKVTSDGSSATSVLMVFASIAALLIVNRA